jgi:murein DD-endopeptidase MepM/ murein hydrolase activator NlpD
MSVLDQTLRRREVILGGTALFALSAFAPFARAQEKRLWFSGPALQGGLVLARAAPGARAWVDNSPVRVDNGLFCFGFAWNDERPLPVRVEFADGTVEETTVTPGKREYQVQRIDGLPQQFVTPPPEQAVRIARDAKAVNDARAFNTDATWFVEKFDWPAEGRISGVYGSHRILNGEPRDPHYGIDIAAPHGAPIKAPADGIVRMAEDLFLSGNTLILDHGHGVSTSYLHMSAFDVQPGDRVRRGDIMGRVGATGRATGPHVCWRMNWFQTRLDAALSASPRPDRT